MYSFCKKNGDIKKHYHFSCNQIVKAEMREHTIMVGRHDEVISQYECYTIPMIHLKTKERDNYVVKVREICSNFNIKIHEWYSFNDVEIHLFGDNVELMISELNLLLRRDSSF